MENGHYPENRQFNPYAEFATKSEVHELESQVRELTKDYAGMAVAIQNLNTTMEKMNNTMENMNSIINILKNNKDVHDKLKIYLGKASIWVGTIISIITTMHWAGIFKMIFKYFMS